MKTNALSASILAAATAVMAAPVADPLLGLTLGGTPTTNSGNLLDINLLPSSPANTNNQCTGNTNGNGVLGLNLLNVIDVNLNDPTTFLNLPPLANIRLGNAVGNTNPVPFAYTSTIDVRAVGSEVINVNTPAPGPADAVGLFKFGLNSAQNTICYNITLINVKIPYRAQYDTATHIHEGVRGKDGIPRIVFPNPVGDDKRRSSIGCLTGPFKTGATLNKADTGANFRVSQIEANPKGFFVDVHTTAYPHGVVRAQMGQ